MFGEVLFAPLYSLAISNASDFFDRIRMSKYARHHAIEKQNPPRDIPRAGWLCEFDGAIVHPDLFARTDFVVARNGRIASVYLFFDSLP